MDFVAAAESDISCATATTYFIGRIAVVRREDGKGLPSLVESAFSFLLRNSSEAMEYYQLPRDKVVEIGRQFAI